MAQAGFEELGLVVVVPRGSGECRQFDLSADPKDTGEKLKRKIEKVCGIPADDLELFAKNADVADAKPKWILEGETLESQQVRDGAVITVGVHGMKGEVSEADPETGDIPSDAVQTSIYSKGDASYYHAHRRRNELPEEHRVAGGGEPRKIGETDTPLPEPKAAAHAINLDGEEDSGRASRRILNYAWGDEKETIKIYISADTEPDAIAAAGEGKGGEIEVDWQPRCLRMRIHDDKFDWLLDLDRIYYDIVPEECKFRVSKGKRVTLTLKKKDSFTWLKLLKPDA